MIKHLKHGEIDLEKYSATIINCAWGRIYALPWYLDIVSPNWEALANEDYSTVMPLPVKKKYGINYITQPYLCQQLGVFSTSTPEKWIFEEFYNKIPFIISRFQGNSCDSVIYPQKSLRPNFFLDTSTLSDPSDGFNKNTIRNLKKAEKSGNTISEIATQKAGIIKKNGCVITGCDQNPDALFVIQNTAAEKNAEFIVAHREFELIKADIHGNTIKLNKLIVNQKKNKIPNF